MVGLKNQDYAATAVMEMSLNMDACIKSTSIQSVKAMTGLKDIDFIQILSMMIDHTANYFNLTKSITKQQSVDTAMLLLERYGYESLEDFCFIFKRAKRGEFGKNYNRLDGQIIFEWANQHFDEKITKRQQIHELIKSRDNKTTEDFTKLILSSDKAGKSILDALKTAIDFDPEQEKKEAEFRKFKKEFVKKSILKNKEQ